MGVENDVYEGNDYYRRPTDYSKYQCRNARNLCNIVRSLTDHELRMAEQ